MKQVLCSKCKMRPAVIFMTKMDGDKQSDSEGLCLKCAMESTGPIKQMMENMGITEDDVDEMSEQFGAMMGMGDDGEGFEPGGIPTFPFLQGMMGKKDAAEEDAVAETEAASENDSKDKKGKNPKEKGAKHNKKRKFLEEFLCLVP